MTLLLDEYLSWLRDARGLALSSVQTTEKHLRDFFRRMGDPDLQAVTIRDLDRYAGRLALDGLAHSTRRGRLIALRGFFAYLVSRGHLTSSPASRLTLPKRKTSRNPDVFSGEEIERLIQAERPPLKRGRREPRAHFDRRLQLRPVIEARDKAMIALFYELALRPGELQLLALSDYQPVGKSWILMLSDSKGSEQPTPLPVHGSLTVPLMAGYLLERTRAGIEHPALFPSLTATRTGSRNLGLSYARVRVILQERMALAGIDPKGRRLAGHSIRRSRATHAYERQPEIENIQILLRHKSLEHTKDYIRTARATKTHRLLKLSLPWIQRRIGPAPGVAETPIPPTGFSETFTRTGVASDPPPRGEGK